MRRLISMLGVLWLAALFQTEIAAQSASDMNARLDTLFGEHEPYQTFFERLKPAVASGEKEAVASMVDYPISVRVDGRAVSIKNEAQFVADYDQIITPKVKAAVSGQSYEALFANWQGVMIGDGQIWFSGVGNANAIRITAINN